MKPPHFARGLRLEPLEARTLFTGGLLSGANALQDVEQAISGTGEFSLIFDAYFGNTVKITGSEEVQLTIDFAKLPDSITRLTLSSFDQVTFVGAEHLEALTIRDTGELQAADMSVGELKAVNVGQVTLAATTESTASFAGTETKLSITDINSTMLISAVDTLTVWSETERVYLMFTRPDQTVQFEYHPTHVDATGDHDWNRQVLFPKINNPEPGTGGGEENPPEVVVVFHLANQRQIHSLLFQLEHSDQLAKVDPDQLLFELSQLDDAAAEDASIVAAAEKGAVQVQFTDVDAPVPHESGIFEEPQMVGADIPTLGALELAEVNVVESDLVVPPNLNADLPPTVFPAAPLSPESRVLVSSNAAPAAAQPSAEELYGLYVFQLDEKMRSLSDYLFDRVSAELKPGQQSAVLLIDPKPSRVGQNGQRESLFDVIA